MVWGGWSGRGRRRRSRWWCQPDEAAAAQRLGEQARHQACLPPLLSEIEILAVARHWCSEFEWHAHKQIALDAGVSSAAIESIRTHQVPDWETPEQATVHEFSKSLLESQRVSDDLFERAIAALGQDGVVDLVGILGYYSLISMTINVFDVPLPAGAAPDLE